MKKSDFQACPFDLVFFIPPCRDCLGVKCGRTLSFADVKRLVIAKSVLLLATLMPIGLLVADSFTNAPSPYFPRHVINNTGDWGLRFLVLTLCVTPLRRLTGWHRVIQLRRTLGLAAFFYSGLHVLLWTYWDWSFQVASMVVHILRSAFLWTGTVALLLLLPLAVTSNRVSMSWLGRRWRALHQLTYLAAILTLGHFWLSGPFGVIHVRKWIVVMVILMGFRLAAARKRLGDRGAAERGAPSRSAKAL